MTDKLFKWGKDGSCPVLHPHSSAKLKVLRDYVVEYLKILTQGTHGQDEMKITFVDAFAGGGRYDNGESGSPFVFLEAVREAQAIINTNQKRHKQLKIDAHFYFVEMARNAFDCLRGSLAHSDWSQEVNKTIFLYHKQFQDVAGEIISRTNKRHPKGGSRVIFFLDQCGWGQISAGLLASLAESLNHKAEFILNFACDWLSQYVTNTPEFCKAYSALGIDDRMPVSELIKLKDETGCDYRYAIAAKLGPVLKEATKAPFFSPFYVEPANGGNHGYWLVHLAPRLRARNAMMDVYYRNQSHIRAFGNTGLQMLAYRPEAGPEGYVLGLDFSEVTRAKAKKDLADDLKKEFPCSFSHGTTFDELCRLRINDTIANVSLMEEAVVHLAHIGFLDVSGPSGGSKRCDTIEPHDRLEINRTPFFAVPDFQRNGRLKG